eukprot:c27791_g1_i1 orf=653-2515(-)
MQACRLSFAQAHPSQVVKVLFDAVSRCTALMLQDSSCLLYCLSWPESPPLRIPPCCTDACFLRLQTRQPANFVPFLSPSFSSRGKSGLAGREFQEGLEEQAGGRGIGYAVRRVGSAVGEDEDAGLRAGVGKLAEEEEWSVRNPGHIRIGEASEVGDATRVRECRKKSSESGSLKSQGYFLSVMSGEGGSCTYVKAWVCDPPLLVRIGVQLQGRKVKNSVVNKAMARLDIPHGLAVKIAASVNAFVVYSPSVGKVWVMSAKTTGSQEGKEQIHNAECRGNFRCAGKQANEEKFSGEARQRCGMQCQRTEIESCLCLIKCAVVDCNGPVYALHLSRQHLFLGQSGGLRIWRLRSLVKGFNRLRRKTAKEENLLCPDSRKADYIGSTGEVMHETNAGDCIDYSKQKFVKEQSSDGWFNTTRSNGNIQHSNREVIFSDKVGQKNDLIQSVYDVEEVGNNAKVGLNSCVCGISFEGDKCLTCWRGGALEKQEDGGSRDYCLRGDPQEALVKKYSGKGMDVDLHTKAVIALKANGITKAHNQFINAFIPCKLWISDGSHSLYILSLPEMHAAEEEMENHVEDETKQLTVSQVVFVAELVHALAVMLDNTMVVLTEGSIVSYSMVRT